MNETDLRHEMDRVSAHLRPRADAQAIWELGARARRRRRAMLVAGAAAGAAVVVIAGVAVQAVDSTAPAPRPETTEPTPPDDTAVPPEQVPYLTEDQVQPMFDPANLASIPWDPASAVRSWNPVDPVPLADDPVEHAAVVLQSGHDEPDFISVLGDDGRWRAVDLSGIELSDSFEYGLGVSRRSLTPDGTQLALGQVDGVVVVDLTTGETTTYDVPGLGPRWQGREVAWSPDATTVYIDSTAPTPGRAVDVSTGDTRAVPFAVSSSAFLADGDVVESYFSMRTGRELRRYDDGRLEFRSTNTDEVLDSLADVVGHGNLWAAQRVDSSWTRADPRGPNAPASGVVVMGADMRPKALLPVKGYGANGGGGGVLGWRRDDTVLFRIWRDAAPAVVVAWSVDSGRLTRIGEYDVTRQIAVAADHLPTP